MRLVRSIRTVFTPSREIEWLGAWVAAGFAAILASPGSTFGLSPTFDGMSAIMPEAGWAACIGIIAAVRIVALLVNGHWKRTPFFRAATAALGCGLWTYVTLLLLRHEWPQTTGVAVYAVIATFEFRTTLRAGRDYVIASRVNAMMAEAPAAEMPWEIAP